MPLWGGFLSADTSVNNNLSFGSEVANIKLASHVLSVYGTVTVDRVGFIGEIGSTGTGILKAYGDLVFNNMWSGDGTLELAKASGVQTLTSTAASAYNNIVHSGAGTVQLLGELRVNRNWNDLVGNLENSNGIFDANGQDILVNGNWNFSGGSFNPSVAGTPGNQTVSIINNSTSLISGNNSFNKLNIDSSGSTSGKTVNFASGSTQTIANSLTLAGASGKVLSLRSDLDGTAWKFVIPADMTSGAWLDVKDSQNTTNAYRITPGANVKNSGNNSPGWNFGLSLVVDSPTLTFGNLLPGSIYAGNTKVTVTVNNLDGYSLNVSDSTPGSDSPLTHTNGTTKITDYSPGTIGTPTLWGGGEFGLGVSVYSATAKEAKWGTGTTASDLFNKYAAVPQNGTEIHLKSAASTLADDTFIGYKLVVPNTQMTGNYSGTITYSATTIIP